MKKYLAINGSSDNNYLRVEVYYSLGGMNYATYKIEPRGYYISVSPVNRGDGIETYRGFSGYKQLIMEVNRQSKKQLEKAIELSREYEEIMIDRLLQETNSQLV